MAHLGIVGNVSYHYSLAALFLQENTMHDSLSLSLFFIYLFFCYRNLTPRQRELIEEFAKEEQVEYNKRAAGASG